MKLNKQFLSQVKYLKHNHILVLIYLYQWIVSKNAPKLVQFENDNKFYFWISINKLAEDLNLSRRQIQNTLYRLENKDKSIQTTLQPFIFPRQVKQENKLYISLNVNMVPFIFEDNLENKNFIFSIQKKLTGNAYNIIKIKEVKKMLLDEDDVNGIHKTWDPHAESIVKRILLKYANVFSTRIPNGKMTKTFSNCCKAVQDIYNGNFINSRIYPLSEKFLNSKQFTIDGWKDKIKEVKGDWNKVKQLIFSSVENYILMFDEKRMPFKKDNLTTSLSEWFYNSYNSGTYEQTSYFIYSLNEPNITSKQLSENKADKIYDQLSTEAQNAGNDLVGLNLKMPAGAFWENIQKMIEWADTLLQYDENAKYWISSGDKIISKFYEFIKEKNLSVSLNTFDIEKSTECNGPWCWFINEAISNHSLNSSLVSCVTNDDFYDCYISKYNEEIIF